MRRYLDDAFLNKEEAMALQFKGAFFSRAMEKGLFFIALLFAFAIGVPWMPDFSITGLDPSWRLSLHYFFEHGYVFGKDIIFTYGPYGFITTCTYYPATYQILFFAYFFFVAVYAVVSWNLFKRAIRSPWGVFFAVLGASLLWAPFPENFFSGDTFFYSCGILFFTSYLAEIDEPYRPRNFFLVGILAASSLMKYSFFIWALGLLFFVSLDGILFRKKVPFLFLWYWGVLGGLWVLAKQPLAGLGAFLLNGARMAQYYGSAMSFVLTSYQLKLVIYLVFTLFFLAVFYVAQRQRMGRRALLPSLTLAAMGFLIFRASFTRPDHYVLAMSYSAILAIYLIPFIAEVLKSKVWKVFLIMLLMAALGLGYSACLKPLAPSFSKLAGRIGNSILRIPYCTFRESRFLPRPKDLQARYENIRGAIRWTDPMPQLFGTVDAYPYDSTGLIAWNLSYKPRPVFQSYAAYTPFLSRKNADHFKSSNAPEFLIFGPNVTEDGKPVDARYPTLDDSLSLPEILSRYDLLATLRGKALLKKTPVPRPYALPLIEKVTAEFGKPIPVPGFDKNPVWVEIDIEPTWWGRIFEFLGRAGRVLITVRALNGTAHAYELPPVMARTGFLLSPLLDDAGGFIDFWTRHFENSGLLQKEVVGLTLEVPSSYRGFFASRFLVRFFEYKT